MTVMNSVRSRLSMAALAVTSLGPLAKTPATSAAADVAPVRVTRADVDWSNEKVAQAYGALVDMWNKDFNAIGERFSAPHIARYQGRVMTPCGVISSNNAQYCSAANAIYYDEVFVAGMAKTAANQLHTDGDMTGIGIIAHEMGHAVAMQLGHTSRDSYENESTADCLAGAFANQAQRDKQLEAGDVEEAIFGMSMAGDPEVRSTGNERYDAILARRVSRQAHGTSDQRVQNFRDGFSGGAGACLSEFRGVR